MAGQKKSRGRANWYWMKHGFLVITNRKKKKERWSARKGSKRTLIGAERLASGVRSMTIPDPLRW